VANRVAGGYAITNSSDLDGEPGKQEFQGVVTVRMCPDPKKKGACYADSGRMAECAASSCRRRRVGREEPDKLDPANQR